MTPDDEPIPLSPEIQNLHEAEQTAARCIAQTTGFLAEEVPDTVDGVTVTIRVGGIGIRLH